MVYIPASLGVFAVMVILHVCLHRALARWGIVTVKTIAIYSLGFFLPLPLTGIMLYGLLVGGYLLFFLSYYWEGQSPSAKILAVVKAHGAREYHQILARFSNKELFDTRLKVLEQSGYIRKRQGVYVVQCKGALLVKLFTGYRTLLRWDKGG